MVSEVKEEEEWPSIGEEELKEEVVSEVKEDEEWPSIGEEELKEEVVSEVKEEEEWPSIGEEELKEEVVSEVKEEEEWPSIGEEDLKQENNLVIQEADVAHDQSDNATEPTEQIAGLDDGVLLIPGLESDSPSPPKKQASKTSVDDSSSTSDSLGELRFSDDD